MKPLHYLVVGSGLTGATIARTLADAGREVLVVERRAHLGGNVHDHVDANGIRVHTYGPHYFRTGSDELWAFVNRFGRFYPYAACLKSLVDGRYESWPIAGSYIRRAIGEDWRAGFTGTPSNFEEASLAMMPWLVYEKFVKGYTEKQWGVPAHTLSADLARRFDVRGDDEPRLVRHAHQGIPVEGYAALMARMLAGIPVIQKCDYLRERSALPRPRLLVFTGPIDEFFGFNLGRLTYRGQQRSHRYLSDVDFALPCGQVNNPDPARGAHIRTLEWKHMMEPARAAEVRGTLLTEEVTVTPDRPDEYEYPFPDAANAALYARYRERADATPGLLICGRLGEYRYYDMDQAIARAQMLARRILSE
jgi:UDP-galactopyranose mutase